LFLCRGIREHAVITEVGPNEEESAILDLGNADLSNDAITDFDFNSWLNDIGTSGTPGAAAPTFLSPAVPSAFLSPAVPSANQDVPALAALPALVDRALLAHPNAVLPPLPPVDPHTFAAHDIARQTPTVPFGLPIGAGPNAAQGLAGFADAARLATLRAFFDDAKALYAEVDGWQDGVPLEARDARVLAGNKTHQLAMQVCV
jgi:hypothetical protein